MSLIGIPRFDDHAHSMYSNLRLIDSINRPKDMILKAYELGMSGLALTDHETVAGHVDWLNSEKKLKETGKIPESFKCACGNEIYLVDDRNNIEKYWHYILVAKNTDGHKALRKLSSIAWYNGFQSRGMMRVPTQKDELVKIVKEFPNTLIASNACLGGQLGYLTLELIKAERRGNDNEIYDWKYKIDQFMNFNIDLFGDDFYIEIAAGTSKDQIKFNQRVISIAAAYNRKIVIGSDAHYLTAKERPIHKAYLNSKEGEREVDEFYWDAHMMDNDEAYDNLKDIFSEDEFKQLCANSMDIYNKIESYNIFRKPIIPRTNVRNYNPTHYDELNQYETLSYLLSSENDQERYWINECIKGLKDKGLYSNPIYLERLETEAKVIKIIGGKLDNCLYEYFNTF